MAVARELQIAMFCTPQRPGAEITRLRAENRSLRDQLARHLGLQRTQHDEHTSAEPQ